VNRGPQSLEVLRFIKQLGSQHHTVLGNHDLHLLAVACGAHPANPKDTLQSILTAPDREELLTWLSHQPLLYHEKDFVLVHAGLAPSWDLATAKRLANEIEMYLQSENKKTFLQHLYGNEPKHFSEALQGWGRARCITNYFTRMRFCHPNGDLELIKNGKVNDETSGLIPWFQLPHRVNANLKIIFGHWAALSGETHTPNVYAVDTGCVWGFCLTAMRLEDLQRVHVECLPN